MRGSEGDQGKDKGEVEGVIKRLRRLRQTRERGKEEEEQIEAI